MRRFRSLVDSAVLVAVLLACTAVGSRLGADDKDKEKHKCPLCGKEDVKFENTPQGAFQKFRFAVAIGDADMLRSCEIGIPEKDVADLPKHRGRELAESLAIEVKSCEVDGDKATLSLTVPEGARFDEMTAVRQEGVWKIDFSSLNAARDEEEAEREAAEAREAAEREKAGAGGVEEKRRNCINHLRQLGIYMVMWVSKFGNDRNYPGPGVRLFTDLYNLPSPDKAICQDTSLLLCEEAGGKVDLDLLRQNDPGCTSYECIDQKLSDGTTKPNWPIAWDKKPHADGNRNVMLFSGAVMEMSEEAFQRSLKQWPGR